MLTGARIFRYQNSFLDYLSAVRGLADLTLKNYARDIEDFRSWLTTFEGMDAEITQKTIRSYIGNCSRRAYSGKSINRKLSALRTFARYLDRIMDSIADDGRIGYTSVPLTKTLQQQSSKTFLDIMLSIRGLKGRKKLPKFLFESEVVPLLEVEVEGEDKPFRDLRDKALLEFMYTTGCRVSEAAGVMLSDLELRRSRVMLLGKGSKQRIAFLGKTASLLMEEYLLERSLRAGPQTGSVFINLNGKSLSVRGIQYILRTRQEKMGLAKHISPHGLRHSFATHVLGRGADIRVVQELLGHANLRSTQVYTHLDISALKDTHALAHPHGSRRYRSTEKGARDE